MEDCGWNDGTKYDNDIDIWCGSGSSMDHIYVLNNVIQADGVSHLSMTIEDDNSTSSYIYIRNNVILNHTNAAFVRINSSGTLDHLHIDNNCLYGNSNSNDPLIQTGSPTNYTFDNNQKADPLFVGGGDYHLQAGSPCINAGIATGFAFIVTDYEGDAISSPPEIGAYEY